MAWIKGYATMLFWNWTHLQQAFLPQWPGSLRSTSLQSKPEHPELCLAKHSHKKHELIPWLTRPNKKWIYFQSDDEKILQQT